MLSGGEWCERWSADTRRVRVIAVKLNFVLKALINVVF